MRTIAANGAIPRNDVGDIANWLGRVSSIWAPRSREAKVKAAHDQKDFVQADVAAFVSTFMRIR